MCGNTRMNYDQNLNVKGMKMLVMFVRDALHFSTQDINIFIFGESI